MCYYDLGPVEAGLDRGEVGVGEVHLCGDQPAAAQFVPTNNQVPTVDI